MGFEPSGVARGGGGKGEHVPRGAGFGNAPSQFMQSFENVY